MPKRLRVRSKSPKSLGFKSYEIIDNGGRPFVADVTSSKIEVYKQVYDDENDTYVKDKKILDTNYEKIFIGDNLLKDKRYAPRVKYLGNSILVQVTPEKYIYIGSEIYSFSPKKDDTIVSYYSPVGNSQVPYPYALGENYAYFMLDKKVVDMYLIDPKKDGYAQYYMNIDATDKKFLRTKSIQKRIV